MPIPIVARRHGQVIYLHGATEGKKLRLIEKHPGYVLRAWEGPPPECRFHHGVESVISSGTAGIDTDEQERARGVAGDRTEVQPRHMREAEAYINDRVREDRHPRHDRIVSAKAKLPKKTNTMRYPI